MSEDISIPHKHLIIQTAVRALRRIHLDYQLFGLGYQAKRVVDFQRLNHSAGAETAHETAVAAAFVQEFHSQLGRQVVTNRTARDSLDLGNSLGPSARLAFPTRQPECRWLARGNNILLFVLGQWPCDSGGCVEPGPNYPTRCS